MFTGALHRMCPCPINYLKAITIEVGQLFNFGPKPEHKRKVYDNERKGTLVWINPQQKINQ